jgi:c-di-GMP-binding flagellar brake protein YcgR
MFFWRKTVPNTNFGGAFSLGSSIEVYLPTGQAYSSMVEDHTNGERSVSAAEASCLALSVPYHQGEIIEFKPGDKLTLVCNRDNGRHIVDAIVIGLWENDIDLLHVRVTENYVRQQRRESYRVYIGRRVDVTKVKSDGTEMPETEESYITTNLSMTGANIRTKKKYYEGDIIKTMFYLEYPNPNSPPVTTFAEVRSCRETDANRHIYNIGVMFCEISGKPLARETDKLVQQMSRFVRVEELRIAQRLKHEG